MARTSPAIDDPEIMVDDFRATGSPLPGGDPEIVDEARESHHHVFRDPSQVFRELVVTAAVRLYSSSCVEACDAFGPELRESAKSSSTMTTFGTAGVEDLATLVLSQRFRCHVDRGGASRLLRRPGGKRLTTLKSSSKLLKSSTILGSTVLDGDSAGSPAPKAGKRSGRKQRSKKSRGTSRLLPISYRLDFNAADGTLTAHPFRPGRPLEPSSAMGFRPGKGPPEGRGKGPRGAESSGSGEPIIIKLRPTSPTFARMLFHSWSVLYYPASLVLNRDAAASVSSFDDLDAATSPHYSRWLESYRFLLHQLSGGYSLRAGGGE